MKYSYEDMLAYYHIGFAHPGGKRLTNSILSQLLLAEGVRVLDAGCGIGETAITLADKYRCEVFAIDLHEKMVNQARKRFEEAGLKIHIQQGNIEALPYDNEYFDCIIAESVTAFTNISSALNEYNRVLKKDGILVINEMTAEDIFLDEEKELLRQFYRVENILSEDDWLSALKQAKFREMEILRKNTVLEELQAYIPEEADFQISLREMNKELEQIMAEHQKLIIEFGEILGYRVIKAIKR